MRSDPNRFLGAVGPVPLAPCRRQSSLSVVVRRLEARAGGSLGKESVFDGNLPWQIYGIEGLLPSNVFGPNFVTVHSCRLLTFM